LTAHPSSGRAEAVSRLAEVFRERGFDGASLSAISQATGLGKGSLYHHFPDGKEEMALAVLEDIDAWFEREVFSPLAAQTPLPLQRLQGEAFAVVMRSVSPDYHNRILAACADAGFEPSLHFELRHWLSVVSVIAQGLGVALVPAALQQAGLPGVVFVPLAQPLAPYDTHCLWRTGHDEAALGAFLATVRAGAQAVHHGGLDEITTRTPT
jgi:AcrR family transcriptional regulator